MVTRLRQVNAELWAVEDQVRDSRDQPLVVAELKKSVDRLNLVRNGLIDEIDHHLDVKFGRVASEEFPPKLWFSETIGSVVDRLTIAQIRYQKLAAKSPTNSRLRLAQSQVEYLQNLLSYGFEELEGGGLRLPPPGKLKMYGACEGDCSR